MAQADDADWTDDELAAACQCFGAVSASPRAVLEILWPALPPASRRLAVEQGQYLRAVSSASDAAETVRRRELPPVARKRIGGARAKAEAASGRLQRTHSVTHDTEFPDMGDSAPAAVPRPAREGLIAEAEIAKQFDDAEVLRLAAVAKLGPRADLTAFGRGIREAVAIYLRDAATPTDGQVRAELEGLRTLLAGKRKPAALAAALAALSDRARWQLTVAGGRLLPVPQPPEGLPPDEAWWDAAGPAVRQLVQFGAVPKEGRKRPDGHRSGSLLPLLRAPKAPERPARRAAERDLVRMLRLAVVEAGSSRQPAKTASGKHSGPFVCLVRDVLDLAGAEDVNAVELVNSVAKENAAVRSKAGKEAR